VARSSGAVADYRAALALYGGAELVGERADSVGEPLRVVEDDHFSHATAG
jgi:hypothetical protein